MRKALVSTVLALSLASPVLADEVWSSDTGNIVYLADEYGAAILSFTDYDGMTGELVFPGLAGNFTERDVHHGYWIGQSDWYCDAGLGRPGGIASLTWGRAVIAFDEPGFPTEFTVLLSDCDGDFERSLRAEPILGGQ